MLETRPADPVKIVAAVLYRDATAWRRAQAAMVRRWGPVGHCSGTWPFTATDYYEPEMGPGLTRRLLSFAHLCCPSELPRLKHEANAIEKSGLRDGKRSVNVDVGYLDLHKLVLASTKPGSQKIYLNDGIWADMTLSYRNGAFEPFPWTFPDFRETRYHPFLATVREAYKADLRQARAAETRPDAARRTGLNPIIRGKPPTGSPGIPSPPAPPSSR